MPAHFQTIKAEADENTLQCKYPMTAGALPENINKNRYKDILPCMPRHVRAHTADDHTRCKLVGAEDYINASLIRSGTDILQIASQGPIPATIADFWAMFMQQSVKVVIMCSRVIENGKASVCFRA